MYAIWGHWNKLDKSLVMISDDEERVVKAMVDTYNERLYQQEVEKLRKNIQNAFLGSTRSSFINMLDVLLKGGIEAEINGIWVIGTHRSYTKITPGIISMSNEKAVIIDYGDYG